MDRQRSARPPGLRRAGPAARTQARRARSAEEQIRGAARPGRGDEAVKAFRQAVDLLERGRHAPAIAQALEAKALAPRSALVREMLGIALYRAERFREALRELQAYRRMTGRADQNHLIADCHRALGAPEKAVEPAIEGIASTAPDEVRAEAAVVAAAALADLGRYSEGLGILRNFRPRSRSAREYELRVWYVTGDILERAGRQREAADEFRRVVRHDSGAFDAAERLASLGG